MNDNHQPVVLDGAAHGVDPFPLLRVPRVVVGREWLDEAADARHGARVTQVGAEEVAVLDQDGRRRRARQLGGAAVRAQLVVHLVQHLNVVVKDQFH